MSNNSDNSAINEAIESFEELPEFEEALVDADKEENPTGRAEDTAESFINEDEGNESEAVADTESNPPAWKKLLSANGIFALVMVGAIGFIILQQFRTPESSQAPTQQAPSFYVGSNSQATQLNEQEEMSEPELDSNRFESQMAAVTNTPIEDEEAEEMEGIERVVLNDLGFEDPYLNDESDS